ncbi:SNF2 family DNA or RNA helicase [Virgibacillus natechei]|uniref:SNF2 family DNA or RNA helicase n=1 Tax=Virgibacillus natechei TaxID=1216297 RepID=A0ABS4IFM6_9BACI|nr:SNF2-related protein [Virgibacillus natechei]MBP1969736.1 SNF2 family DNA or RNA helicase [Virgibacillus natechei]UZD11456.1 DEAD/DEAH box helicase [Virgibacillus natechei]
MKSIHLQKDSTFIDNLQANFEQDGKFSPWDLFSMAYQAELTTITPEFSGLRSLEHLPHVDFLDHQISTAEQAIEDMNGRAILADEVGLGKTIEAGLILKEYMIRGLVKKALILVPASLVNQWVTELNEKFYIPAVAHRKNYTWEQSDVIITSLDTAKRSPHQEAILDINYDFILIDEAHKLKNHKTKNYSFVRQLKKKYCLLLTATPVQNRLLEIFNLVSLLKPGHLGNYDSFLDQYGKDRKKIKQDIYLKQLIQKVMIRNTRKDTILNNTKRHIETIWIDFKPEHQQVYDELNDITMPFSSFSKITFLREMCSSREACYLSLKKLTKEEKKEETLQPVLEKIEQLPHHVKAEKLVELLKKIGDEKVIVFTEYRATQYYLQWYLQQEGISSVPFRGGFKKGKKDWMRQLFRDHAQVLIATEAGGEGINLQFCNQMVNYDLPWNPMRLEQRIGRIHRYGQENDVHVYNFAIRDTIEEHIMNLLYEKINLFERVIGQLDDILAELNIADIEKEIESIYTEASSTGEAKIKLDNLSSIIKQNHEHADSQERQYGNY